MTDAIDQHPHCVLLLDEIEKAHPDLFNILLQVMDHGKLTDHNGKTVDFRNVILIMTTNAGAADMAKPAIGFGQETRIGEDVDAITSAHSSLEQAAQALSKVLYEQTAQRGGTAPEAAAGAGKGPDDTIDAEFEVKG